MQLSRESNERLWDAVIKEALIESMNRELEETEQNMEAHNFSAPFEKEMNRLIKSIGRKEKFQEARKVLCKLTVTAAAVLGIMFGGLLTQQEVYAAVGNVFRSIFSTHDKYTYQGFDEDIVFDNTKRLGYIPDGYEIRSIFFGGNAMLMTYESIDDKTISFEYAVADGTSISVDNERHIYKEIVNDGQTYYFYEPIEENDSAILIWYDSGYVYNIDGDISEDEFIKIARNITG